MLRRFVFAALERSVNRAYRSRLALRGTEPEGVFWRNKSSQIARFDALLSMLNPRLRGQQFVMWAAAMAPCLTSLAIPSAIKLSLTVALI